MNTMKLDPTLCVYIHFFRVIFSLFRVYRPKNLRKITVGVYLVRKGKVYYKQTKSSCRHIHTTQTHTDTQTHTCTEWHQAQGKPFLTEKGQDSEEWESSRKTEENSWWQKKNLERQNRKRKGPSVYSAIFYRLLMQPLCGRLASSQRMSCLKLSV